MRLGKKSRDNKSTLNRNSRLNEMFQNENLRDPTRASPKELEKIN